MDSSSQQTIFEHIIYIHICIFIYLYLPLSFIFLEQWMSYVNESADFCGAY